MTIEEGIREETATTGHMKTTKGTKEEVIGKKKVLENIQEERDDLEEETRTEEGKKKAPET